MPERSTTMKLIMELDELLREPVDLAVQGRWWDLAAMICEHFEADPLSTPNDHENLERLLSSFVSIYQALDKGSPPPFNEATAALGALRESIIRRMSP